MKRLQKLKRRVNSYEQFFSELLFTFLFKDLLYIFLPLVVIIFTYGFFGQFDLFAFLASSDLAFAITVLNATILSSFIELKVKHQNSPSWRLYEGSKLYILLVVISTLVLAFIILNDIKGLNTNINNKTLGTVNSVMLLMSVAALFINNFSLLSTKHGLWSNTNGNTILRRTKELLLNSSTESEKIIHLIKHTHQEKLLEFPADERELQLYRKHEVEKINHLAKQYRENLELIEKELQILVQGDDSQQTI